MSPTSTSRHRPYVSKLSPTQCNPVFHLGLPYLVGLTPHARNFLSFPLWIRTLGLFILPYPQTRVDRALPPHQAVTGPRRLRFPVGVTFRPPIGLMVRPVLPAR